MFKKRKTETTDKQETPEKETGAAEIKAPTPPAAGPCRACE